MDIDILAETAVKIDMRAIIELSFIAIIAIARAITLYTKTKADDKYLDKNIPKTLRFISFVFGYDLRQGRKYLPK